ncbi:cache domain-containing protein [Candidatus Daviesbacteria bacterium]|nr:cache domain-containing protein [Candidatus Daviesbacteria bacterium]
MWNQFFLENAHFALNLFASLVFFLTGWLYFDAWLGRKTLSDSFKILGFILLSISFLIHATFIESTILESSLLGGNLNSNLVAATRITGYLFLILGLIFEPIQAHFKLKLALFTLPPLSLSLLPVTFPILSLVVAFLYLRRATVGLESHLKPLSLTFYVLALAETLSLAGLLQNTPFIDLYEMVAPHGLVWLISHGVLLLAMVILGRWVYFYLLKRIQSQLFMISTFSVLIIFLITTTAFTGLLLKNLEDETLKRLETDVKVLNYAVDSKKAEALSDAQVLSSDPQIVAAVEAKDKASLSKKAEDFLLTKKQNLLVIVSETGQVLARGEDKERIGDSLSDDPQITRALVGEANTSVGTKDGVLGPEVSVRAAAPIKSGEKVVGAVMSGTNIDNAFVDGIKAATGLEAAIYGDNILAATTLLAADGKSRYIGVKEENSNIKEKVLVNGESFTTSVNLLNTPYFAAYLPLKDVDTNPVGMLFVGKRQIGVLQAAGRSIEFTFLVAVGLLILSIIPAYLIARFISSQIK